MTATPTPADRRPREEDYSDYENRDIDGGWPYADGVRAPQDNPDYSNDLADRDENTGFRVAGIDDAGNQSDLRDNVLPATDDRENSDDIEERVTEQLSLLDDIALDTIDVHADGHVVTLTGSVDDVTQMRRIELAAASVDGVRHVRNRMRTIGVDSHMSDED